MWYCYKPFDAANCSLDSIDVGCNRASENVDKAGHGAGTDYSLLLVAELKNIKICYHLQLIKSVGSRAVRRTYQMARICFEHRVQRRGALTRRWDGPGMDCTII